MKIIDNFDGDFRFLSNFSPHGFSDTLGVWWQTNEHFYQAMKTIDMVERGGIWSASTPGQAKKMGQTVTMRKSWNTLKFAVMNEGIIMKFMGNKDIRELLISTKGYKLIEGNAWHDNIWGNCICPKCENVRGNNYLGKVLEIIREGFINGE